MKVEAVKLRDIIDNIKDNTANSGRLHYKSKTHPCSSERDMANYLHSDYFYSQNRIVGGPFLTNMERWHSFFDT